jgi:hypothetical protein
MTESTEALLQQVATLLDKQAVYEVLLGIARGLDRFDGELLAACIHPDALLDMGGETPISGTAFAALKAPAQPPRGRMHLIANPAIEVEGDHARAESYVVSCQELQAATGTETRLRAGRYLDRFERRDSVWKLARRTLIDEWGRIDPVKQAPPRGRHRGRPAPDDLAYKDPTA